MKRKFTKVNLKTLFLSVSLMFGYSPAVILAGTPQLSEKAPWAAKSPAEELKEQRSRTSKSYKNQDGSVSTFIAPASLHYKNAGQWLDISTDIEANIGSNSLTHPYAAAKNSVKTYFPSNPFSNYILMSSAEGGFKEKVSQICFMDAANNMISALPLSGAVSNVVNGNTITYTGFYPGLSLVYKMSNDSRKFDLVINSQSFLNAIPAGAHHLAIMEEFVSNNFASVTEKDNGVFVNINNTDVLMLSQPVAFDNNLTNDEHVEGSIALRNNSTGYSLQSNFPVSWIQSSQRVFPIHLDPTVNYYPQFVTNWTGYTTATAKTNGIVRMLDNTTVAWAKFDITTLPAGAFIQSANYWGNYYSSTLGVKIVNIRGMASVDPVPATAANLFAQATTGTIYNNNYSFGTAAYGWNMGALGGTAPADISSAYYSQGWFGVGFQYVSGTTAYEYQYGNNGTSTTICYLEVTYTVTPCSGTVTPNSVVSPTYAVCSSTNVALSLASTYTVAGLSYQWLSSTITNVGPWTPITNATLSAYSTPSTNINTYYSVQVTCATGGTANATSGLVQIESVITNTPSYHEGFESLNYNNQLPNCSWSISGGNSLTYTVPTSGNRVARTGNKFGAFAAATGTNYFYTNGLMLNAGVTYSASMWYLTEATGLINFTDLSMFIGTTQSPVGAIPVATTNGPAVASVYKRLANTFTVPSSGIYYLAIRATSNGGSYYLSFDDVSVTIPCSINAPTLSVTGGTTTCSGSPVTIGVAGAHTYTWSVNNLHTAAISVTPVVTANAVVNYSVTGTSTLSGCTTSLVRPVTVNVGPAVSVFPINPTVCEGHSTVIYASSTNQSTNFVWNTSGAPGYSAQVSPAATSVYSVNATTNANNCMTTRTIEVTVVANPTIIPSSSRSMICAGESVNLTATGATSYMWIDNYSGLSLIGGNINQVLNSTTTFMVLGTDATTGCSSTASFVQNVSACTGISKIAGSTGIKVSPNPNNGMFTVELSDNSVKTLTVIDLTGKVLLSNITSDAAVNFNLSAYANGIYYVKIQSNDGIKTIKIVKQ